MTASSRGPAIQLTAPVGHNAAADVARRPCHLLSDRRAQVGRARSAIFSNRPSDNPEVKPRRSKACTTRHPHFQVYTHTSRNVHPTSLPYFALLRVFASPRLRALPAILSYTIDAAFASAGHGPLPRPRHPRALPESRIPLTAPRRCGSRTARDPASSSRLRAVECPAPAQPPILPMARSQKQPVSTSDRHATRRRSKKGKKKRRARNRISRPGARVLRTRWASPGRCARGDGAGWSACGRACGRRRGARTHHDRADVALDGRGGEQDVCARRCGRAGVFGSGAGSRRGGEGGGRHVQACSRATWRASAVVGSRQRSGTTDDGRTARNNLLKPSCPTATRRRDDAEHGVGGTEHGIRTNNGTRTTAEHDPQSTIKHDPRITQHKPRNTNHIKKRKSATAQIPLA